MCNFFSFVTEPENHGGERFFFDWEFRKKRRNRDYADSHSHICQHFKLREDLCNKYEYSPLTKKFVKDQINSPTNDCLQAEEWVNNLDFKNVVKPLIIKPIINPFKLSKVGKPNDEQIQLLKKWAIFLGSNTSYTDYSIFDSVSYWVSASVGSYVMDVVSKTIRSSISSVASKIDCSISDNSRYHIGQSVRNSIWAYISTFFEIKYKRDYSPAVKLWEMGIVPSYEEYSKTWRLHSGEHAHVIYRISRKELLSI